MIGSSEIHLSQYLSISAFTLMDWISEHFQVVVVIALVFASWLKHRMDAKAAEREENQPPREMEDEEYDLGPAENWPQPMPSVPPPLVRQIPPPLVRQSPPQLREDREHAAQLKRQQDLQDRVRQIRETKTATTGGAAATRTRVAAAQSHAKPIHLIFREFALADCTTISAMCC